MDHNVSPLVRNMEKPGLSDCISSDEKVKRKLPLLPNYKNFFKDHLAGIERHLEKITGGSSENIWKKLLPIKFLNNCVEFSKGEAELNKSLYKYDPYSKEWLNEFKALALARLAAISYSAIRCKDQSLRFQHRIWYERFFGAYMAVLEIEERHKHFSKKGGDSHKGKLGPVKNFVFEMCRLLNDPRSANVNSIKNIIRSKKRDFSDLCEDLDISQVSYSDECIEFRHNDKPNKIKNKNLRNLISQFKKKN